MPFSGVLNSKMRSLAGLGRGGDTAMAHLTPGEVVIPRSIAQMYPDLVQSVSDAIRRRGRNPRDFIVGAPEGNVNAMTGMEEFVDTSEGGTGSETGRSSESLGEAGGSRGFGSSFDAGGFGPGNNNTPETPADLAGNQLGTGGGFVGDPTDPTQGFGAPSGPPGPTGGGFVGDPTDPTQGFETPSPPAEGEFSDPPGTFGGRPHGPQSGARSQTAADKEVRGTLGIGRVGENMPDRGFFEKAIGSFTNQSPATRVGMAGLSFANPALGAIAGLGKAAIAGFTPDKTYTDEINDYLNRGDIAQTATASPEQAQGGPLGGLNDNSTGGDNSGMAARVAQIIAQGQAQTQTHGQIPSVTTPGAAPQPIQATASPLSPQQAAQIADDLGVSNDALQARAQIATFALNSNGGDFRTAEAAALWETLLAQSYSPNPGLLDIERQYMAQVLGFGDQAYEGEDEAARGLAQTGAPIRRAQVAV